MKRIPRILCQNGVSLSVQANEFAYCTPRSNFGPYTHVEVGFIRDSNGDQIAPPDSWREYADGEFPSDVYAYVPVKLVRDFMAANDIMKIKQIN